MVKKVRGKVAHFKMWDMDALINDTYDAGLCR